MQRLFATCSMVVFCWLWPVIGYSLTKPYGGNFFPIFHNQSQVFVSSTTSLVRQNARHACVQSAGVDWKSSSTALKLSNGTRVDLRELQSNTPFVSYVQASDGAKHLRFALGFRITPDSLRFEAGTAEVNKLKFEIEPRGDAILISDTTSIARVLARLNAADGLRITAQSFKLNPDSTEHLVSHLYQMNDDPLGLAACEELAQKPLPEQLGELRIGLASMPREDADINQMRAVACNRDLDPEGAELVALAALDGAALPLSHALVKRDRNGSIATIWAGDLLRIERRGGSYEVRISNSVRAQGLLEEQSIAACTRMSAPTCATVTENDQGRISIAQCLPDLIAFASAPGVGSSLPEPLNALSRTGSGARGPSAGGGGGTGSAITSATSDPDSDDFDELFVLASHDPERTNTDVDQNTGSDPLTGSNPDDNPAIVPVPPALGFLIFAIGMMVGFTKRRISAT